MRSYFIFPADNEKFISKAFASNADTLIFDLEDSVKKANKQIARNNLKKFIKKTKKKIYIRVNSLDLKTFSKDIKSSNLKYISGFLIPKSECQIYLSKQLNIIRKYFKKKFKIILLIETPKGLLNLDKILSKKNLLNLEGLMFGHEDFSSDLLKYFDEDLKFYEYFRNLMLLHSKANKLNAIDTPTLELNSKKKISKYFKSSFKDGFDGALIVHPNQIDLANTNYTPHPKDVERAKQICLASKKSNSIFVLNKKFIGPPIIKRAINIQKKNNELLTFKKKN